MSAHMTLWLTLTLLALTLTLTSCCTFRGFRCEPNQWSCRRRGGQCSMETGRCRCTLAYNPYNYYRGDPGDAPSYESPSYESGRPLYGQPYYGRRFYGRPTFYGRRNYVDPDMHPASESNMEARTNMMVQMTRMYNMMT